MNKRFLISIIVIFVLSMALDFFIHGNLLYTDYSKLPNLFRAEQDSQKYFPFMLIAHVLIAVAFVWIYVKGKEDKPFFMQGIRYGIAIAFLTVVPSYMIYYAVQPMPADLVIKQIVFGTFALLILGVVVARLNK